MQRPKTHDPLWNAAQTQLFRDGRIHNYLRMLWGKKNLESARSPREALDVMIELNNRYAIDGRDPNSYSGIFRCLGRCDRPWGPGRPIFGIVRYISSDDTKRKLRVHGIHGDSTARRKRPTNQLACLPKQYSDFAVRTYSRPSLIAGVATQLSPKSFVAICFQSRPALMTLIAPEASTR